MPAFPSASSIERSALRGVLMVLAGLSGFLCVGGILNQSEGLSGVATVFAVAVSGLAGSIPRDR